MVQWLGLHIFTAEAQVQPPVGELRSHKPHGTAKKKNLSKELQRKIIDVFS